MPLFLFFVSFKCAFKNKQKHFYLRPTKQIIELATLLYKAGYIAGFCLLRHESSKSLILRINLKYHVGSHGSIDKFCSFSTPTAQKFITYKNLWLTKTNGGVVFLSTSFGYLSLNEAKKLNTGGELLFYIA